MFSVRSEVALPWPMPAMMVIRPAQPLSERTNSEESTPQFDREPNERHWSISETAELFATVKPVIRRFSLFYPAFRWLRIAETSLPAYPDLACPKTFRFWAKICMKTVCPDQGLIGIIPGS